jgi:hypothetical protein
MPAMAKESSSTPTFQPTGHNISVRIADKTLLIHKGHRLYRDMMAPKVFIMVKSRATCKVMTFKPKARKLLAKDSLICTNTTILAVMPKATLDITTAMPKATLDITTAMPKVTLDITTAMPKATLDITMLMARVPHRTTYRDKELGAAVPPQVKVVYRKPPHTLPTLSIRRLDLHLLENRLAGLLSRVRAVVPQLLSGFHL